MAATAAICAVLNEPLFRFGGGVAHVAVMSVVGALAFGAVWQLLVLVFGEVTPD